MISENEWCYFHLDREFSNKFLPGQFWPCLLVASVSVPSDMTPSPNVLSCGPKLRPLCSCDMKLCGDGWEIRFEWVSSAAVIPVEDHVLQFKIIN